MKFLLLGKGKTIKYIKKYILSKNDEVIHAVFKHEYSDKYILADERLLELDDIDYVIKSPGISETNQLYLRLSRKFTFICELDLLKIYNEKVKSIVVTGSNGKTTFVSMLKHIFVKSILNVIACGNSFNPISKYYKKFNKLDYILIEQSSFQLHDLKMYNPFISIILNMTPNHLDMSYSLSSYYENKRNIYKYQNKDNYFIYDSENTLIKLNNCNANIVELLHYDDFNKLNENLMKYTLNINYIYTILKLLNIDIRSLMYLNSFKELKYRNNVRKINNTIIVNDSKSTSVAATLFSLKRFKDKNVILLIGGKDKKLDYSKLKEYKNVIIICYGQLASIIKLNNVIKAKTLSNAFKIAINIDLANKVILFSPSTSSFDQFKSYKHRGKYFNKLVRKYKKYL